jgi:hypothetical protein
LFAGWRPYHKKEILQQKEENNNNNKPSVPFPQEGDIIQKLYESSYNKNNFNESVTPGNAFVVSSIKYPLYQISKVENVNNIQTVSNGTSKSNYSQTTNNTTFPFSYMTVLDLYDVKNISLKENVLLLFL